MNIIRHLNFREMKYFIFESKITGLNHHLLLNDLHEKEYPYMIRKAPKRRQTSLWSRTPAWCYSRTFQANFNKLLDLYYVGYI